MESTTRQVLLGRVDADSERALFGEILEGFEAAAKHLPLIILWAASRKSRQFLLYDGAHERNDIVEFVHKQLGLPVRKLTSVSAVEKFVENPRFQAMGTTSSTVVSVSHFYYDIEV